MNKQSNTYTIIYILVLAAVVGTALAFTSLSLHDRQLENADLDKMSQILASAGIVPEKGQVAADFKKYIIAQEIVDCDGNRVEGDAFNVDVAAQSKLNDCGRQLPVFVCRPDDGSTKYILPVYGSGLWGPIWGYIAIDSDGTTVYGAYFAHQGETPGLGAEIVKPEFRNQFEGKRLIKNGVFMPISVVKAGQKPSGNEDYVDGVSGGTITSKGVGTMLDNCLSPYKSFLNQLSNN